ncbi:hypothetical protein ACOY72_03690 [Acinetobacter seifertii]|uniref:hypothetical protein n=1 Tax=Acinetobacter seifertii TaxID=1530123 RepID=UPI003BD6AEA3
MTQLTPMMQLRARFEDKCGHPLAGGSVFTFDVGTTTPKETYADAAATKVNTNPIKLDYRGEADIFLLSGRYRFVVYSKSGTLIYDVDDVGDWFGSTISDAIVITEDGATQRAFNALTKTGSANKFDPVTASKGYYNIGSIVRLNDGSEVISTIDNNQSNPNSNMTGWQYSLVATNKDYPPVLSERSIRFQLKYLTACLRYGLNDPLPLDNNTNMFRGLTNKDAWADENLGVGSVAFGRNGCSKAYLTTTFGHDCITYGVASLAGGAGSGTGNPDVPTDGANYGYCALAYGKDTAAIGRISTAFGQNNKAATIHSFASGYESETGKGLATHPVLDGVAVDDDGDCAFSYGYRAFSYGNYSVAFGNFVRAYHGSKVIGSGINAGSLLEGLVPKSIVFGSGVDVPTIILTDGDVAENGGFGKVGFNTKYKPRERVEVVLKDGDKVAIRSSNNTTTGGGSLELQGTLGTGASASIFRIEYTSPNAGQAYGVTTFYQNGSKFLTVAETGDPTFNRILNSQYGYQVDGKRVIGGQMPAIANLPSDATLSDVITKLNALLTSLREGTGHGLIAP